MKFDTTILELVLDASLLVQMVMLLLLTLSFVSWYLIFYNSRRLKKAGQHARSFEDWFWKSRDFASLYNRINAHDYHEQGMEKLFMAGYTEFARMRKQAEAIAADRLSATQRAMQIVLNNEADELEKNLPTLATIGSVSPYIGLFGTVWGIMHSFHALADAKQVTLAMVAPGISEALIATALGLFAAIPAVIAYNQQITQVDRLLSRYHSFSEEFTSVLQRHAYTSPAATGATSSTNE
ncbi:protein TolQ [Candidatus Venteria ishoeyi]|uniref:Tol-Pal system protein TolQ n=1 Tax=Candidatus Venteria ishoeyi TaxID=1899563 RepID=A0A1H6FD47_9GAMM|nr:protein TolQ [Candidatus Venteria ishoeyi]MDM8545253.1 protein TolQ [Candidatus Venteria ishoeyi]SEH07086.1 Biopolymer transport protein ExbB [Candidatus Venteria ishoeyi]